MPHSDLSPAARPPAMLVLAVTVLMATPGARAQEPDAPAAAWAEWHETVQRFADRLSADVAADGVGGLTAGVFVGETPLWVQGFGWADPQRGVPAGANTIYRVGSISKSFTGVVLAQLVDAGTVALDDPVVGEVPELAKLRDPAATAGRITYRQLASHTAGLVREPAMTAALRGPSGLWEEKVLAAIPTTLAERRPGERYAYSNIGFGILGLALGRAAGQPFTELVRERIVAPLGMEATGFTVAPAQLHRLAVGHGTGGDGVDRATPAREHAGRGYQVPDGGMYATVADLARLAAAVGGHTPMAILTPPVRRELATVQTPGNGSQGYSLGFSVRVREDGRRLLGHGGLVPGYSAHLLFEPRSGVGVVLLRNYDRGATDLEAAALELLEALLRQPWTNAVRR
jgi:CubicO group peptidase (beta-lactamase class C family)